MRIKLWDLPTRLFHWGLVALLLVSWISGENEQMTIHFYSGYAIFTLILFRVFWGLWGSTTARFAHFLKGPRAVLAYMTTLTKRTPSHHPGHNPLGALSVVAMLACVAAQVGLGLFALDVDYIDVGPLAEMIPYRMAAASLDWHELNFNILLVLVGLHIAVILFYRVYKRENLVRAMITGQAQIPDQATDKRHSFQGVKRAVPTLILSGLIVWFTVSVLPTL